MLEEEYNPRRKLPPHLKPAPPPEPEFAFEIRDAVARDIPDMLEIYNHYVMNSTVTFDEDALTLAEMRAKFAKVDELHYPWIVAVSRSHGDARSESFIEARPGAIRQMLGSAVKFCRVAEGGADIYPRLSPTCEWDVAAGHAVVVAAGGCVTDGSGAPLGFGGARKGFIMPEFIAWGDPTAPKSF